MDLVKRVRSAVFKGYLVINPNKAVILPLSSSLPFNFTSVPTPGVLTVNSQSSLSCDFLKTVSQSVQIFKC